MAGAPKQDGPAAGAPKPPPPKVNPVFRMMGLPNFRWKLPSRNWMIFLTIAGAWTTAVVYDRREKKRLQKKWCDLVADIAQQTSNPRELPRTLNVILAAPPGDSLAASQVYFKEYIKPVLVAAALEYDLIQGRREGDVRYGVAEQIRRLRRKKGEKGAAEQDVNADPEQILDAYRQMTGAYTPPGVKGDVVIGRHTWKEYIRGLHEGWLGPLDAPVVDESVATESSPPEGETKEEAEKREKKEEEERKRKAKEKPAAYIATSAYSSAQLSPFTPAVLEPSQPFHQYHLLGFLKTPIRMWHFLNQRKLADECGRQAAAVVLAAYRPYEQEQAQPDHSEEGQSQGQDKAQLRWEQQTVNEADELSWVKSVRKPKKMDESKERLWMAEVVIDPRIGSRMRRFQLDPAEEARATRIGLGQEKGRAVEPVDLEKQATMIGNLDD